MATRRKPTGLLLSARIIILFIARLLRDPYLKNLLKPATDKDFEG
jgi:hypothetical protein